MAMKAYGEAQNVTPVTPKLLNRSSPKLALVIKLGIPTVLQNFIQIGQRVSFWRMRNYAPPKKCLIGYILGSSSHLQPRRHHGH